MTRRIENHIVRGEMDNRQRGLVRGRLWLAGIAEPVVLELQGNAKPDLAGCLLEFENTGSPEPMKHRLSPVQTGTTGVITALQTIRVLDLSLAEALQRIQQGKSLAEHSVRRFYFEWFGKEDGRIIIESSSFKLTVSQPAWHPDRDSGAERTLFMAQVDDVLSEAKRKPRHRED